MKLDPEQSRRRSASLKERRQTLKALCWYDRIKNTGEHFVNKYSYRTADNRIVMQAGIQKGWLKFDTSSDSRYYRLVLGSVSPSAEERARIIAAALDKRWPKPSRGWGS